VLVLFTALTVALVTYDRGLGNSLVGLTGGGCAVLLGASAVRRRRIPTHPRGSALTLELELAGLVLLVVNVLALLILGLGFLTGLTSDASLTYIVGVLSGALVGFFSKDVFTATESESWFALHYRARMNTCFLSFFLRRTAEGRWVGENQARWDPAGIESDALAAEQFAHAGSVVTGWDRDARRRRDEVLQEGVDRAPWVPT